MKRSPIALAALALLAGVGHAAYLTNCTPSLDLQNITATVSPGNNKFTTFTGMECPASPGGMCCWTEHVVVQRWNTVSGTWLTVTDTTTPRNKVCGTSNIVSTKDFPVGGGSTYKLTLTTSDCAGTWHETDTKEVNF